MTSSLPSHTMSASPQTDPALVQLSIHSLPQPAQMQAQQRTRTGRWKMLMVLAVCAAPVLASYLAYYVFKPQGRSNYGDLIEPPRPMPSDALLMLRSADGQPVLASSLKGQWLLVTVGGGACDPACEQRLYLQRQIRESLGKDKDRVDRVWLITDGQPMRDALRPAMSGATVLSADGAALAAWLLPAPGQALADHWYLVDPRGQWMMRFEPKAEPRKVLKDLTRLLKAAASWDEAGRP
jgi:cytochrome oxidase Cu insertion factor (SCO1/SenC/PrrC family)